MKAERAGRDVGGGWRGDSRVFGAGVCAYVAVGGPRGGGAARVDWGAYSDLDLVLGLLPLRA